MFKKTFHIILAFNLLVTSIGVTIDKHYCGEALQNISLYIEAASCCDTEEERDENCCHNESESFQIEDDYQKVKQDYNFTTQFTFITRVYYILADFFISEVENPTANFKTYMPPIIACYIPVIVQSFLL